MTNMNNELLQGFEYIRFRKKTKEIFLSRNLKSQTAYYDMIQYPLILK